MIERYSLPEMAAIWSETNRLAVWKEVETLVAEVWADLGIGSTETAAALRAAPEVGVDAWKERESVTNHDVAAFVDLLAESVGLGGEWVHFGLTSSDVVDTANGVLMRDAGDLLLGRMGELFEVIRAAALGAAVFGGLGTIAFFVLITVVGGRVRFSDDLDAVIPGLIASDVSLDVPPCGAGSVLSGEGTGFLTFSGGELPPLGGTCSFDVEVTVPTAASAPLVVLTAVTISMPTVSSSSGRSAAMRPNTLKSP